MTTQCQWLESRPRSRGNFGKTTQWGTIILRNTVARSHFQVSSCIQVIELPPNLKLEIWESLTLSYSLSFPSHTLLPSPSPSCSSPRPMPEGPSLPRFCAPQFQAPAVRGRLGAEALPSDVLPEGQWCLMLRRNARVIPPASLIAETFYPLASSQEGWVQCTKMFGERPRSLAFYDNRLL